MDLEKVCKSCLQKLPMSSFYRRTISADGHQNRCIECTRQRVKAFNAKYAQTEKFKTQQRRYRQSPKGKAYLAKVHQRRKLRPEYRVWYRNWQRTAPAAKARTKRYWESPKGKERKRLKDQRYKSSPLGLMAAHRSNEIRHRLKTGASATLTLKEWLEITKKNGGRCFYCRQKKALTMDHLIPLSKGGEHTKENIVPACLACNVRKADQMMLVAILAM